MSAEQGTIPEVTFEAQGYDGVPLKRIPVVDRAAEIGRLRAEVARMRPVVEAAIRHVGAPDGYLRLEVEAYREASNA